VGDGGGPGGGGGAGSAAIDGAPRLTETAAFKVGIATVYVLLWCAYPLLVRRSQADSRAPYNAVAAVLVIELVKFSVSVAVCIARGVVWHSQWRKGCLFAGPALIYAVYNALVFVNLALFDAASYQVLMNTRIVIAGILFEKIFNRRLGLVRWCAIVILVIGVSVLQIRGGGDDATGLASIIQLRPALILILVQASLSSLAGVYSEALLKDNSLELPAQNAWMYFFSIIVNLIGALFKDPDFGPSSVATMLTSASVAPVIIVGAIAGISTSLLLKYLNVVTKAFCTATEMVITAIFSWAVLGEDYFPAQVIAILIVSTAVVLYSLPERTREAWETYYRENVAGARVAV
jgi:drug/metabolite transporter (DMT)-like permease